MINKIFCFLFAGLLGLSTTPESACGRVQRSAGKLLKKRYGMELNSIGSGNDSEDPSKYGCLIFGFGAQGKLTIDQAREYAVASTEDLLELINTSKLLAPHLGVHPFGPENMLITINFHGPDGYLSTAPFVTSICVRKGCVFYQICEEGPTYDCSSEYVETYEDALAIAQGREPDKS